MSREAKRLDSVPGGALRTMGPQATSFGRRGRQCSQSAARGRRDDEAGRSWDFVRAAMPRDDRERFLTRRIREALVHMDPLLELLQVAPTNTPLGGVRELILSQDGVAESDGGEQAYEDSSHGWTPGPRWMPAGYGGARAGVWISDTVATPHRMSLFSGPPRTPRGDPGVSRAPPASVSPLPEGPLGQTG
ncbi:MAG: hypothetical protein ACI80N_000306 [Gammaproteobacteria bacterium]|jgi:hypothetical protein